MTLVALCHADLTVKHKLVCFPSTHGEMGKAFLLSQFKALSDKALSAKCELSS